MNVHCRCEYVPTLSPYVTASIPESPLWRHCVSANSNRDKQAGTQTTVFANCIQSLLHVVSAWRPWRQYVNSCSPLKRTLAINLLRIWSMVFWIAFKSGRQKTRATIHTLSRRSSRDNGRRALQRCYFPEHVPVLDTWKKQTVWHSVRRDKSCLPYGWIAVLLCTTFFSSISW